MPVKLSNSPYFTATAIFLRRMRIGLCGGVVELCRQTRFFWKYALDARIVPIVLSAPAVSSPNREMP